MNIRQFYTWHRRFGIVISVFVLLLIISGFALNHTEKLGLDGHHIDNNWLLDWYKIEVDGPILAYSLNDTVVVQLGERLYFESNEIKSNIIQLIGAVR